jgi:hypothetical protein
LTSNRRFKGYIVRLLGESLEYRPAKVFGFTPGADIRDIYPALEKVSYEGFAIDAS